MTSTADRQREIFIEVHQQMPRQGPGNFDCTARALAAIPELPESPRVLDMGCGPGAQTCALAELLPGASITGIDLSPVLAAEAAAHVNSAGLGDRVTITVGDMRDAGEAADLIWSEGAAYIIGVGTALARWRERLRSPGFIAYTDAVWLRDDAPAELREFWHEYPDMKNVDTHRVRARALGYRVLTDFILPPTAWAEYYGPLQHRVNVVRERHDDAISQQVLDQVQHEIDLYERYPDYYSYVFIVLAA